MAITILHPRGSEIMGISAIDADFAEVGASKVRPSRRRWHLFLGLLVPFTVLTFLGVSSGSADDLRDRPIVLTTLATITGPFTGAIARPGESSCLGFSLKLAGICGPLLALGLLAQVVPLPFRRGREAVRLLAWTLGWFAWLSGGPASFLYAFG